MERFSRKLYYTLDHLGYNADMLQFRRETWKYYSDITKNYQYYGLHQIITAGSKGEGITSILESDFDTMTLDNNVVCIYTAEQLPSQLSNHMTVLLVDMENVPPGYTRLKLHRPASFRIVNKQIRECLFEFQGELYLSSTMWTDTLKANVHISAGFMTNEITGPALPGTNCSMVDFDFVLGFPVLRPQLLQAWASRPRQHEWPSEDIIRTACSFLPQVVPVGAKGSDRQYQEWRFCFIESELALTHSLNGTQIKLYILLKMIAKNILKPVTCEMSSYLMKNITYWLSELLPLYVFREEKLASLVFLALMFLRSAITRRQNLPYYMIPSRNLLSERLDAQTRIELSDVLYRLIQEGPRLFLRIEKLRFFLEIPCLSPDYIVQFGNMRDLLEKRCLAFIVLGRLQMYGLLPHDNRHNLKHSIVHLIVQIKSMNHPRHGVFLGHDAQNVFARILSEIL